MLSSMSHLREWEVLMVVRRVVGPQKQTQKPTQSSRDERKKPSEGRPHIWVWQRKSHFDATPLSTVEMVLMSMQTNYGDRATGDRSTISTRRERAPSRKRGADI